jgi:hypothetical protein
MRHRLYFSISPFLYHSISLFRLPRLFKKHGSEIEGTRSDHRNVAGVTVSISLFLYHLSLYSDHLDRLWKLRDTPQKPQTKGANVPISFVPILCPLNPSITITSTFEQRKEAPFSASASFRGTLWDATKFVHSESLPSESLPSESLIQVHDRLPPLDSEVLAYANCNLPNRLDLFSRRTIIQSTFRQIQGL